jgi:hypothetical protein
MNHNPKHIQALKEGKAPLEHLLGGEVDAAEARVLAHGAGKYGVRNWRKDPILLKTYVGAIRRHLNAWADGQDNDPDSGESHLAHIRACCAVALDAQHQGTAQDDRTFMESKGSPVIEEPYPPGVFDDIKIGEPVDLLTFDGLRHGDQFEWNMGGTIFQRQVRGHKVFEDSCERGEAGDHVYAKNFHRYTVKAPR